jgi:nitrogen regulatory protein P-II 1
MDLSQHGEEAYADDEGTVLVFPGHSYPAPTTATLAFAKRGDVTAMKLIVAIIRPEKLNDVLEALYRAEVRGLTVSRVLGHGGETEAVETYRGTTVKVALQEKVRLEIGVSEPFVDVTVRAILASAETGEVGDGKIFVLPVQAVHRIRTRERDEAAVTPMRVNGAVW